MAETAAEKPKPKRARTLIMVGALVVGEAGLILGVLALFSGPPKVQGSSALEPAVVAEEEKIVEQLVVDARLPNSKRGVTYLYEAEIYVQVKRRHQDAVAAHIEQFRNEIKAELATVWRTSDPRDFDEPKLETLTRKVHALMDQRLGLDPLTNQPVVEKVVIVMGTGLRVET